MYEMNVAYTWIKVEDHWMKVIVDHFLRLGGSSGRMRTSRAISSGTKGYQGYQRVSRGIKGYNGVSRVPRILHSSHEEWNFWKKSSTNDITNYGFYY